MSPHACCDQKPLLDQQGRCTCHVNFYPERKSRKVVLGAIHLMKRWPTHVFCALLAACLLLTAFVILTLITAVLIKTPLHEKCRSLANPEGGDQPLNVYFIKHDYRNWEETEFCYIEATARLNPSFNFFLINLLPSEEHTIANEKLKRYTFDNFLNYYIQMEKWNKNITYLLNVVNSVSNERLKLANEVQNIKNIDISIERFFFGSQFLNISSSLRPRNLEFVAKIYALWTYPGIALEPNYIRDFKNLSELNFKNDKLLEEEKSVILELDDDFQAVNVPCHSFLDLVIRQILKNPESFNRQNLFTRALRTYCERPTGCPNVRILTEGTKQKSNTVSCPTIRPHKIPKHRLLYDIL